MSGGAFVLDVGIQEAKGNGGDGGGCGEKEELVAVRLIGSLVTVGGGGENGRSIELPP
jgi:hypothetical protein